MTLLETTEPLFQYICRLNRAARKGAGRDFVSVRGEVKSKFEQVRLRVQALCKSQDPNLRDKGFKLDKQYRAVELPLIFYVDSMIAESKLPCAREWHMKRLAFEQNELAGDEKFFDLLEETLREPGDDATDRLAIFYTCLGLGFTGYFNEQPQLLRMKMLELSARIRAVLEPDPSARICPEAYQYTDGRDLIEPPTGRVWLLVVVFLVCLVTAIACNIYLFKKASDDLTAALRRIIQVEEKGELGN